MLPLQISPLFLVGLLFDHLSLIFDKLAVIEDPLLVFFLGFLEIVKVLSTDVVPVLVYAAEELTKGKSYLFKGVLFVEEPFFSVGPDLLLLML